ncbi:MAG: hypothetical protein L0G99_12340, partial [Propionibacteriales bacterium]|nr:hypothetical protein [Propionibacteriales bacterium]
MSDGTTPYRPRRALPSVVADDDFEDADVSGDQPSESSAPRRSSGAADTEHVDQGNDPDWIARQLNEDAPSPAPYEASSQETPQYESSQYEPSPQNQPAPYASAHEPEQDASAQYGQAPYESAPSEPAQYGAPHETAPYEATPYEAGQYEGPQYSASADTALDEADATVLRPPRDAASSGWTGHDPDDAAAPQRDVALEDHLAVGPAHHAGRDHVALLVLQPGLVCVTLAGVVQTLDAQHRLAHLL